MKDFYFVIAVVLLLVCSWIVVYVIWNIFCGRVGELALKIWRRIKRTTTHQYVVSYIANEGIRQIAGNIDFGISSTWRPGSAKLFTEYMNNQEGVENTVITSIFYMGEFDKSAADEASRRSN